MSTPAQSSGTKGGLGIGLGILLGCGGGCLLVVVAIVGLGVVLTMNVMGEVEKLEQQAEARRETVGQLARLDDAHPPELPEDGAEAVLDAADVDDYLVVWSAAEPPLLRQAEFEQRLEEMAGRMEGGEQPSFGDVFGMMSEIQGAVTDAAAAEVDLPRHLLDALTEVGMGPTDFRRMIEIVEWRFLGRDEAAGLVLDDAKSAELRTARQDLERLEDLVANPDLDPAFAELWLEEPLPEGATGADARRLLERRQSAVRDRLAELEQELASSRALTPATETALEARRDALEARPEIDFGPIVRIVEDARRAGPGSAPGDEPESASTTDVDSSVDPVDPVDPVGATASGAAPTDD